MEVKAISISYRYLLQFVTSLIPVFSDALLIHLPTQPACNLILTSQQAQRYMRIFQLSIQEILILMATPILEDKILINFSSNFKQAALPTYFKLPVSKHFKALNLLSASFLLEVLPTAHLSTLITLQDN